MHSPGAPAPLMGPGRGADFFATGIHTRSDPSVHDVRVPSVGVARNSLRVLVIDDHPDTAESVRLFLEIVGHEVQTAHSGADGVAAARRFRPHVVLCDLVMPEMDGFATARALREEAGLADARLIAVSGLGSEADRRRCLEWGFERHLLKPVDPEELQRLLGTPAAR